MSYQDEKIGQLATRCTRWDIKIDDWPKTAALVTKDPFYFYPQPVRNQNLVQSRYETRKLLKEIDQNCNLVRPRRNPVLMAGLRLRQSQRMR